MSVRTQAAVVFLVALGALWGQRFSGPPRGTLIVDGGGSSNPVKERFAALAGGKTPGFCLSHGRVVDPVRSAEYDPRSGLAARPPRMGGVPELPDEVVGTEHLTVLHTRDRAVADSDDFVKPLRAATGVFLGTGNAGRIAQSYLGTRTRKELQAFLDRGGVVFGSSAGSIILGSFVVRWYYWLNPGDRFDLATWQKAAP